MTRDVIAAPTPEEQEHRHHGRDGARSSLTAQWLGFFLAPAAFFAHLQAAYLLVPWSCASGNQLVLQLVHAIALIAAAIGTVIARRVWVADDEGQPYGSGGPHSRARFLGVVGAVMGATFMLLLAGQWAASLFLSPCQ
jgi:hypothetical protein